MDVMWSVEDRAAARAFLQRCEVRLSTLHRVATALLSGAGLMVLLPAMMKDQIAGVIGAVLTTDPTPSHVLLAIIAAIVLGLPLMVFFVLLGDLTRFYFHAQHVETPSGTVFAPRLTLTGLRLPIDDLSKAAQESLESARRDRGAVELVVPPNPHGRDRIDQRLAAYGIVVDSDCELSDEQRSAGLFELVASRSRPLAEEVAKVEHGMTRHLLRLQVIVMRYVKALLVFLVTALAVFAAAAAVSSDDRVGDTGVLWLATIFAVWAPLMVLAVSSPVRWVESLLLAEGAAGHSVSADPELTRFERIAINIGAVELILVGAVLVVRAVDGASNAEIGTGAAVMAVTGGAFAVVARRSVARPTTARRGSGPKRSS
jgi:hypothetical protein